MYIYSTCMLCKETVSVRRAVVKKAYYKHEFTACSLWLLCAGYAGRTELPDNLKSMFRPIAMVVPDSGMIAEIILFGEGMSQTRLLARKVNTLYSLAAKQLSKQDHYDFGLRALVSVLRYAGKKKRLQPETPDEEVLLLAMKDMNIAKLTADDLPLFNGIVSDLFPGVETPLLDYSLVSHSSYIHAYLLCVLYCMYLHMGIHASST